MLTRKKLSENADPKSRIIIGGPKLGPNISNKGMAQGPVKYEPVRLKKPAVGQSTRRAAFGDITNATKEPLHQNEKKKLAGPIKPIGKANINVTCNKINKPIVKKKTELKKRTDNHANVSKKTVTSCVTTSHSDQTSSHQPLSNKEQAPLDLPAEVPSERIEEDFSFVIIEDTDDKNETDKPDSLEDVDQSIMACDLENYTDVFHVGIYAQHIFDYYKRREKMFRMSAYMNENYRVSPTMRAILVDWMVEVQENFELCHESLYLAVKLTDMYMSRVVIEKDMLQLVGAVAIFIAAKFDERCPPLIDDFIYICDNAFERDQFILMEMEILRTVDFDLGIPITYTFLRRYAKVARVSLTTLTLARFILEMSLMEYDLVVARDSMVAAAALYIAQKMRNEGTWEGDVVKSCGYTVEDIKDLIVALNVMLHARPVPQLSIIRSKYSHEIFHEVAKIAPLSTEQLLQP